MTHINLRWYSVTMGTGIVSILLHNLPYNAIWIYWFSVIFFALNCLLFALFTVISLVRYIVYPEIWGAMIRHPTQSLFLGTVPMGFATLVNMVVFVCVPAWGEEWVYVAWGMWWVDAAVSVAVCVYLPFVLYVLPYLLSYTFLALLFKECPASCVGSVKSSVNFNNPFQF